MNAYLSADAWNERPTPQPASEDPARVIQADREAAFALMNMVCKVAWSGDEMRQGKVDHHEYVQAFKNHRLTAPQAPSAVREALPKSIGRLHLSDNASDGERLCSHGHEVAAGHPLYWPEMISQFDDSDPYCLLHAIEKAESEAGWSADAAEHAAVADQIIGQIEERFPNWQSYRDLIDCIDCTLHDLKSPPTALSSTQDNEEGLRDALTVGERFLDACFSAWSCGEPSHRVKTMLDRAYEFQVALSALSARASLSNAQGGEK